MDLFLFGLLGFVFGAAFVIGFIIWMIKADDKYFK